MFDTIVYDLRMGIEAALGWFATLFNSVSGAWYFFLAFFVAFISYRAIVRPLLGNAVGASNSFHEQRKRTYDRSSYYE